MSKTSVPSWQPWWVVFCASLFFFYAFIQMNMFNAVNPALMQTFDVGPTATGDLSAYYFYFDVAFLFPAGIILDRVSTRWALAIAMAVTVIAVTLFSFAHDLTQAAICRSFIGAAGAFCLLGSVRVATRWFPPKHLALVIGCVVTMAMLGGLVAQTPLTILTDTVGWRHAMLWDGLLGLVLWGVLLLGVKDFPPGFKKANMLSHRAKFWHTLAVVLRNPQNWLAGLFISLMNLPVFLLGGNWGSLYLVEVDKLTRDAASWVIMAFFLGLIIGSPLFGAWSDRWGRRRLPMIVSALLAVFIVMLLMYARLTMPGLFITFFMLGFISGAQVIGFPMIAESNSLQLTGTAEGLGSVLIMGGGFTVPLFAYLMNWHWDKHYLNHLPFYSVVNFDLALAIMPVAFIVAFVAAVFTKETFCKPYVEQK